MIFSRKEKSKTLFKNTTPVTNRFSRKNNHGYAMVLFVIVLLVITVMSTTVTTTAFEAASSSRDAGNRLKARALASSSINEFYGRVLNHPELIVINEESGTASVPSNNGVYEHLAFRPLGDKSKWASINGSKVEACDPVVDKAKDCYFIQLRVEKDGPSTRYRWVVVEVTTRVGCDIDGSDCTYSKYQQRIRRMQFFDFLFFHQFSTLDPKRYTDIYGSNPSVNVADFVRECSKRASSRSVANLGSYRCAEVSYLEDPSSGVKDRINGPLYTADDYITVCGNPEFAKRILVHGSGFQQGGTRTAWRPFNTIDPNTSCGVTNGSITATLNAPLLEMPEYGPTSSEVRNGLRATDFRLSPIDSSSPIGVEISSSTITITNATNSFGCSTTCSMGSNAVIYVENAGAKELELKGVTNGQLMVYATGDIEITGDLTYQGVSNLTSLLANSTTVTGIVAQGEIKICQMGECGPYTPVRSIHAYLVSLGGAPHVPGWSNNANPKWANPTDLTLPTAPRLVLLGGIAGKYQGVFGGYEGVSRYVVQGYVKDFSFDDRLARGTVPTPPLLVSPKSSAWLRVDISEVPVDESSLK